MKTCAFCQFKNNDKAKFCRNCGKDLNKEPSKPFKEKIEEGLFYLIMIFTVSSVAYTVYEREYKIKEFRYFVKPEIVSWYHSNSDISLDLYNGTEYWLKSMQINLYLYKTLGAACEEREEYEYGDEYKEYKFELELDEEKLLEPSTSGSYTIDVGAIITKTKYNKECMYIRISDVKGYKNRW